MVHGRAGEVARIDGLLKQARSGDSGVLVIRGEAGIGKSTLLDHAVESAAGMRVLRGAGIEAETELPFAGLHLLLGREIERVDQLPQAQAQALRAALGLEQSSGGDRFLVGLAVLTLLSDLAEEQPLLCVIDDAHWLDHGSTEALLFAARRLQADPIAMIFAARDGDAPEFPTPGMDELRLSGLDDAAAAALLGTREDLLPAQVRQGIIAEARGNPLALLELPVALGRRATSSTFNRIRQAFTARISALPERTQVLLVVAAADETGDPAVVVTAAERLGCTVEDLEPAEHARLLRITSGRLEFRHPLIRTAAYQDAPLSRRLAAHEALAAVFADRNDICHHAWHLSSASTGPDEKAAAALERAAEGDRPGGGHSAVAAMYEQAAKLSPDRADRGRRLAVAALAAADAGQWDRADVLAERASDDTDDALGLAKIALVRSTLLDERDRAKDAYRLLTSSALPLAVEAPDTAGYLLFRAARAAANAGDFEALDRTAAQAEDLNLPNAAHVRAIARAFTGQHEIGTAGTGDGTRALRELVDAMNVCGNMRELGEVGWWHLLLGDIEAAHDIASGLERHCRERGAIGLLASVLPLLARTQLMLGKHHEALASATEGIRIAADTGQRRHAIYLTTVLAQRAAIQGEEQRCVELTAEPLARGVAPGNVHATGALSLLDLGLGRYEQALGRLTGVVAGSNRQGAMSSLPDLVEAAVRAERPEVAARAAEWHGSWAAQLKQPWVQAIALRCKALLATDKEAGTVYAEAVELHRKGGPPFERARTELLHGEWLRRARQRADARVQLHSALEIFDQLGAQPWAERARGELRAAGESVGPRGADHDLADRLTPQESQVVRLAATGLSNREIGAQLFLSPRTVGYHLYKAYPKLGVTSRGELAGLTWREPVSGSRNAT